MIQSKTDARVGVSDNTDIENRPISASSVNTYLRCPMQWFFRYIEGKKIPPSGSMYLGSQWHKVAENNYTQKITSKKDKPVAQMKEVFVDFFDRGFKEQEVHLENGEKEKSELKDTGIAITNVYAARLAPQVQPVKVEEKFLISVEGIKKQVIGFWDVIDKDGFVRDNKSKSRTPAQSDVDNDLQLSIYAYAYRQVYGIREKGLTLDCAITTKVPQGVIMRTSRTNNDIEDVLKVVKGVEQATKSGIFYPNSNGWHCSEKWCGFYPLCKGRKCGK